MYKWLIIGSLALFPCVLSCMGTQGNSQIRHIDLFDHDDSVRVEIFEGKPQGRMAVEVDAHAAAVPFGTDDVFHVGTSHFPDSSRCGFVYVFSLKPESIDTVSSTVLRYNFSLGRNGRVMLMSARHPEGITEALNNLDAQIGKGWIQNK